MTPIALYPSNASLKKSVVVGLFLFFIGYQYLTWSPNGEPIIPAMFAIGGLYVLGQTAWSYFKPSPSFEADADGFSVMGKKKRSWDEYRGVRIHTVRVGIFPAARWVIVKTGKTILGGRVHIKWSHLSAPAKDMAAEIEGYAQIAKSGAFAAMPGAEPARELPLRAAAFNPAPRPERLGEPLAAPQSFAARLQATGAGPVQSTPRLSERLFGRRKVI